MVRPWVWVSAKTGARRRSDLWTSPFSVRSYVARKLTPARKAWISKLRHGEHQWQRRPSLTRPWAGTPVDSFDARRAQADSLAAVRDMLRHAGIEFVELPRLSVFSPTLVIDSEFSLQALQAIAATHDFAPGSGAERSSWTIRYFTADKSEIGARKAKKHHSRIASITCLRHHIAANDETCRPRRSQ